MERHLKYALWHLGHASLRCTGNTQEAIRDLTLELVPFVRGDPTTDPLDWLQDLMAQDLDVVQQKLDAMHAAMDVLHQRLEAARLQDHQDQGKWDTMVSALAASLAHSRFLKNGCVG